MSRSSSFFTPVEPAAFSLSTAPRIPTRLSRFNERVAQEDESFRKEAGEKRALAALKLLKETRENPDSLKKNKQLIKARSFNEAHVKKHLVKRTQSEESKQSLPNELPDEAPLNAIQANTDENSSSPQISASEISLTPSTEAYFELKFKHLQKDVNLLNIASTVTEDEIRMLREINPSELTEDQARILELANQLAEKNTNTIMASILNNKLFKSIEERHPAPDITTQAIQTIPDTSSSEAKDRDSFTLVIQESALQGNEVRHSITRLSREFEESHRTNATISKQDNKAKEDESCCTSCFSFLRRR